MVGRGTVIRRTTRKRVRPGTLFRMGTTSGIPTPPTSPINPVYPLRREETTYHGTYPGDPLRHSYPYVDGSLRAGLSYHAAARGSYLRSGPTPSKTSEERAACIYRKYLQVTLQLQESQERVNGLLEALRIIDSLVATVLGMRHP
ncbi:hypothetical protein L1987_53134 [Smallanthus sonchifolius]|uniref:Uncharacterized protein n=1 Tax=Smallanthus sonchifolius TaxID=185202 RepID=A0ACB9EVT6_9ASTR|nr:hypothetical protein L1987_53134 [Smallanthus sonchifolius]